MSAKRFFFVRLGELNHSKGSTVSPPKFLEDDTRGVRRHFRKTSRWREVGKYLWSLEVIPASRDGVPPHLATLRSPPP